MRFAEKGDFSAVRALWETCFPDEGGFNDYFFAHFYKEKYTLLYLEGETLVAMVQMLPYRMMVGGVSREVTYIYGACTDPAHRRKGYMARLLERSFELDREAGALRPCSFRQKSGCLIFTNRSATSHSSIFRAGRLPARQGSAKHLGG